MGQAYSHHEPLSDTGRKAWKFSSFFAPRDLHPEATAEEIERWMQSIFRAVPLSCLSETAWPAD